MARLYKLRSGAGGGLRSLLTSGSLLLGGSAAHIKSTPGTGFDGAAELPRVTPVRTPPVVTGNTWNVNTSQGLQDALNGAAPGDEIVLDPTVSYSRGGGFIAPNKTGAGYIVVRSANVAALPVGRRIRPALDEAQMPHLLAPGGNAPALDVSPSSHHWWFIGLWFEVPTSITSLNSLVRFGNGNCTLQGSLAQVPHHIGLDRCAVLGHSTLAGSRGVQVNSSQTVIADCYIDEWHAVSDAQAIFIYNTPGEILIDNCYLAGSGENFLVGGGDVCFNGTNQSDITVRRCYFFTPFAWVASWTVKNIFELKTGIRVLLEDSILDGSWSDGQTGLAINIKTVNQDGSMTWAQTKDVVIRWCEVRNSEWLASLAFKPEVHPAIGMTRVTMRSLLFRNGLQTKLTQLNGPLKDITIDRVTATENQHEQSMYFVGSAGAGNLVFTNNRLWGGETLAFILAAGGGEIPGGGSGQTALNNYCTGGPWTCTGNSFISGNAGDNLPAGNCLPATVAEADPCGAGVDQAALAVRLADVETGDFS